MNGLQIFDEWSTYEKLVEKDYMHHSTFFARLVEEVDSRLAQPLSIIDIGCGDARPIVTLLRRFGIDRYVGIDQSETALDRAREVLGAENISPDLRVGSMLVELESMDGQFDLAIASYSLHHLESPDKQAALSSCRRLLRPDGMLAIIDVFLDEDESSSAYFERWQRNARQSYTALAANELDFLIDHVRSCDIPESVSGYRRMGVSAGFPTATVLCRDPEHLNKLIVLS